VKHFSTLYQNVQKIHPKPYNNTKRQPDANLGPIYIHNCKCEPSNHKDSFHSVVPFFCPHFHFSVEIHGNQVAICETGGGGTLEIMEKLGLPIMGYYLTLIKGIVQNKIQVYFDLLKELTFVINH